MAENRDAQKPSQESDEDVDRELQRIEEDPPKKLEDWPEDFEWVLGTMLDGAQGNPRSALATDTAPNEGRGLVDE